MPKIGKTRCESKFLAERLMTRQALDKMERDERQKTREAYGQDSLDREYLLLGMLRPSNQPLR